MRTSQSRTGPRLLSTGIAAVAAAAAVLSIATRLHPLWLLAFGVVVGLSGVGFD